MARRSVYPNIVATDEQLKRTIDSLLGFKKSLIRDFIPYEIEKFENYGSVYLPSFRPKEVHDRFDY
ncbi:hypothetical protein D3C71_2085820 [compost metagenome]